MVKVTDPIGVWLFVLFIRATTRLKPYLDPKWIVKVKEPLRVWLYVLFTKAYTVKVKYIDLAFDCLYMLLRILSERWFLNIN